MKKFGISNWIIATGLSLCMTGALAAEHSSEEIHGTEEAHSKHVLGIFAGTTHEDHENHETFGFEYSYRVNTAWSVGGVIERADREKSSTLVIAFAHWWPYKGLFAGAGIGRKDPGDKRENTIRATLGYEFELGGGWVIAPQFNLDFIENHENEEVLGIAFGKQF